MGVALAGLAVALEFIGFLLRLTGAHGETARLLSMDAPLSVPRMYITVLFAFAAVAALSGASRNSGRRAWWLGVGVVAAGICFVKAGGTVHEVAMQWLDRSIGSAGAFVVSARGRSAKSGRTTSPPGGSGEMGTTRSDFETLYWNGVLPGRGADAACVLAQATTRPTQMLRRGRRIPRR